MHDFNILKQARDIAERYRNRAQIEENAMVVGRIKTYLLPPISEAEYAAWWPKLREAERERYLVSDVPNIVTQNGRTQILTYVGNGSINAGLIGNINPFAQYFSVGIGLIATLSAGDVTVNGEIFRAAPSAAIISGNAVALSTFFGSGSANGTYTNCGFYGVGATATLGTGTLLTHALYSFVKTSANSLTTTYIVNVN